MRRILTVSVMVLLIVCVFATAVLGFFSKSSWVEKAYMNTYLYKRYCVQAVTNTNYSYVRAGWCNNQTGTYYWGPQRYSNRTLDTISSNSDYVSDSLTNYVGVEQTLG